VRRKESRLGWREVIDSDALARHSTIGTRELVYRTDSMDDAYECIVRQPTEKGARVA
jgi:hypothetical protein